MASSNHKHKVSVLISGRGSNLKALIDACKTPDYPAEIVHVLSNNPEAAGLYYAKDAGIPFDVVNHKDYASREAFEAVAQEHLRSCGAELLCLAGFMRVLTDSFITQWENRIINIHPSLLPSFKGIHTHRRALEEGVKITGCTVHFVCPEVDAGAIIMQAAVPVMPEDTPQSLEQRVLQAEHIIFPQALKWVAEGKIRTTQAGVVFENTKKPESILINPPV